MAQVILNDAQILRKAERKAIRSIAPVAQIGCQTAAAATPRDTGLGQDSWWWKVVDPNGTMVAGMEKDGNDNPTPDVQGYPNIIMAYVGSNEGVKTGKWYLPYVNRGVYGRAGKLMKQKARAAMDAARKRRRW